MREDLIECSKITKHVYGINVETSEPTSRGIFFALKSTHDFINNNVNFSDLHIAITGFVKVGGKLAKLLINAGAKVTAASINRELLSELKKEIEMIEVSPANLFKINCDIISPCALGGVINTSNRNQLKCKGIVGAANNQLDNSETGLSLIHI